MTDFATAARPRRPLIAACVVLAALLQTLDATIANVALPHMQGTLSATADQISWVLTSYLIAAAIMTPAIGWLSGRFGRRRLFLLSMAGFTAASMACGAAQTLDQMVAFRLVQGVFGAALVPLSQAVMLDMYAPHERGSAMSIWAVGIMVGPIIGPTLGALLTESYNWRYVFYVNLPVGIVAFLGIWAFLPRSPVNRALRFDWTGFLALAVGIAGLQLVLDRGETKDWFGSVEIALEATASMAGFYVFFVQMVLGRAPFLTVATFRDRNFVTSLGLQFVCGVVLNGTAVLLPPYFQGLGNYPVLLSGLAMAPRGIGTILAAPFVGRLVNRTDPRLLMLCGLIVLAYSTWQMSLWTPDVSIDAQIPMVLLQGVTISLVFTPLQTIAFSTLPAEYRTECSGRDGAVPQSGRVDRRGRHGNAAGAQHPGRAPGFGAVCDAIQSRPAKRAAHRTWDLGTRQGLASLDALITYHASIVAFSDDCLVMVAAMLPAAALLLFMRRPARTAAVALHEAVE